MHQRSAAAVGSVVCPTIIGRDTLLAELREAVDLARTGQARPILISGEAGMGKSRIVTAIQTVARDQGFRVLRGTCFQHDGTCPFAPFLDLARAHFTSAVDFGPVAPDLYPLLPELAPLPEGAASRPPIEAEHQRRHLLSVLVQLFLHQASQQPVLIVIEDLHWSDDDSLDWLHLLMRRAADHRLLIVMTLRREDAGPGIQRWLDLLNRERLVKELMLTPLSIEQVGEMLGAIFSLSQPARREFLEPIYELSQGNPFVVEELLKSLVEAGEIIHTENGWTRNPIEHLRPRIPRSVQHAVQQRCAGLDEAARHLLRLAAVAGRRVDVEVLQAITELDESTLLGILKALVAAQLLVEESADHLAFRHALTQQAISAELLSRERRSIHKAIAETIENVHASSLDRYAGELSDHYYEAEVWEKALQYSLRLGQQARGLYSPRATVVHLTRAIEASVHLDREVPAALYRARGQANELLGNFEATLADFEAALQRTQSTGDQRETWQLLLDIGFLWTGRDYLQAHDYFRRALALARDLVDPSTIAHSLNRIGNWHANQEEGDLAIQQHLDALQIFERVGDQPAIASTLDLLSMATALNGDLVQALQYGRRALRIFEELDDRQGIVSCLTTIGMAPSTVYESSVCAGAPASPDPMPALDQALTMTRDIDWRSGEAFALGIIGEMLAGRGDFGRALVELDHGLALAEEIGHQQWMIQSLYGLGCLHRDLYQFAQGEQYLRHALALATSIHSPVWINMVTGDLASVMIACGDLASADTMLASCPSTLPMRTIGQRLVWCARVELALAQAEPEQALSMIDHLYREAANLTHEGAIPRLARLKGEALAQCGQADAAMALIASAIPLVESLNGLPVLYQLHVSLAGIASSSGQHGAAERHAMTATALIDRIASTLTDKAMIEEFISGATSRLRLDEMRQTANKSTMSSLTAREWEVARLITQGLTNREIGDMLFVSTRTIETHVANVLHKLGFTSRAQIAGWAAEHAAHDAT